MHPERAWLMKFSQATQDPFHTPAERIAMVTIRSFDGGGFEGYLALPAREYGPGIVVLLKRNVRVGLLTLAPLKDWIHS